MSNEQAIDNFVQHILKVTAPTTDIGSGVIPSLSGMVNAKSDNTQQLHNAVKEFAWTYINGRDSSQQAGTVEGLIMASVTLGTVSEEHGVALIDELHSLSTAKL